MGTVSIVASVTAANGRVINYRVERAGVDGSRNCWRAIVTVDGTPMGHFHRDTAEAADVWAKSMRDAYLEIHGGPVGK